LEGNVMAGTPSALRPWAMAANVVDTHPDESS
jgi:hypothetical protein